MDGLASKTRVDAFQMSSQLEAEILLPALCLPVAAVAVGALQANAYVVLLSGIGGGFKPACELKKDVNVLEQ